MHAGSLAVQSMGSTQAASNRWSAPAMAVGSSRLGKSNFPSAVPSYVLSTQAQMMPPATGGAVLANAQPPSGGMFDRQFEWSSRLLEQNRSYFKNPSFRGCQEQVPKASNSLCNVPLCHSQSLC